MILFNYTHYIAFSDRVIVNYKKERMWKEAVTASFKILSQHLLRLTEKKHVYCKMGFT